MLPDILPLKPYFRSMIWGGRGLETRFDKPLPGNQAIGEAWEVSAYEAMESVVSEGPLAGQTLRGLAQTHGPELMGQAVYKRYAGEFPLLIKLLDARENLSIQVHPDDTYARSQNLGTFGKMEAWYVLHSDNGQIACGLQDGVDKTALESAIRNDRVQDVVRFFDAHPGDVVFMPPGTVHALCKNVMIYEVQQSSDLTFRIYDYNRPGVNGRPRDLHINQALDVITFGAPTPEPTPWYAMPEATESHTRLVESDHFRLERFGPPGAAEHMYSSFAALTLLSGQAEVKNQAEAYAVGKGDTALISAERRFTLTPQGNLPIEYLISSVP